MLTSTKNNSNNNLLFYNQLVVVRVCHLLHIVGYLQHLNYDPVCEVYESHLVKIRLWKTNHPALFLLAVVCLNI